MLTELVWCSVKNECCTHKYPYTHAHHSKTVTFFFISVFLVDFDIQQIIIDKWNTESKWNFFSASSSHVWVGVFPLELDIWVNLTTAKRTENYFSLPLSLAHFISQKLSDAHTLNYVTVTPSSTYWKLYIHMKKRKKNMTNTEQVLCSFKWMNEPLGE